MEPASRRRRQIDAPADSSSAANPDQYGENEEPEQRADSQQNARRNRRPYPRRQPRSARRDADDVEIGEEAVQEDYIGNYLGSPLTAQGNLSNNRSRNSGFSGPRVYDGVDPSDTQSNSSVDSYANAYP